MDKHNKQNWAYLAIVAIVAIVAVVVLVMNFWSSSDSALVVDEEGNIVGEASRGGPLVVGDTHNEVLACANSCYGAYCCPESTSEREGCNMAENSCVRDCVNDCYAKGGEASKYVAPKLRVIKP